MSSLADRLAKLPGEQWSPGESRPRKALDALERALARKLPADYRELLLASSGGSLTGKRTTINFEPLEILKGHNHDERFAKYIPGMFVIGDDGGGSIYYYDPGNQLGRGADAVFLVSLGTLGFPESIFAGATITAVIDAICSGEDLYDRPRLKDGKPVRPAG